MQFARHKVLSGYSNVANWTWPVHVQTLSQMRPLDLKVVGNNSLHCMQIPKRLKHLLRNGFIFKCMTEDWLAPMKVPYEGPGANHTCKLAFPIEPS